MFDWVLNTHLYYSFFCSSFWLGGTIFHALVDMHNIVHENYKFEIKPYKKLIILTAFFNF